MLKAKLKYVFKDCCNDDSFGYKTTVADFLNKIGKDNFISLDDDRNIARIWYWDLVEDEIKD